MESVGTALGDHVDHTAARASDFRRIGVGCDLEFLNGILAEAIRAAARAGASGGLSEERVVGVGAVHLQAVRGTALAAEGEIATTGVASDAGGEGDEVEEVTAVDGEVPNGLFVDGGGGLGAGGAQAAGLHDAPAG